VVRNDVPAALIIDAVIYLLVMCQRHLILRMRAFNTLDPDPS
jgi:hypothetical protein